MSRNFDIINTQQVIIFEGLSQYTYVIKLTWHFFLKSTWQKELNMSFAE